MTAEPPAGLDGTPPEPAPEKPAVEDRSNCDFIPQFDVRVCMVCGKQMEGRKCKYICRSCGTMIDCSDAY